MRKYCKAYPLHELRQYQAWQEKLAENGAILSNDTIVYLWDDFTVVESPILNQENLFENVTPEWKEFCEKTLKFAIPEDLKYAYTAE